ncbi:hypothetical protein FKM82_025993 [Ascaphus truei]
MTESFKENVEVRSSGCSMVSTSSCTSSSSLSSSSSRRSSLPRGSEWDARSSATSSAFTSSSNGPAISTIFSVTVSSESESSKPSKSSPKCGHKFFQPLSLLFPLCLSKHLLQF